MMKKLGKLLFMMTFLLAMTFAFTGCGNNNASNEDNTAESTQKSTENKNTDGAAGNDMQDTADNRENTEESVGDNVGDAAKDIGNAAGDVVDDVADGVGDAIDNLGGGSFDQYDDAKKYLLDKLKKDNTNAKYEVREETKDLTSYNHNDSGAEGYKFSVYETDGNEKIGIYYVDKDTGKIYRYMGKNSIEAY